MLYITHIERTRSDQNQTMAVIFRSRVISFQLLLKTKLRVGLSTGKK